MLHEVKVPPYRSVGDWRENLLIIIAIIVGLLILAGACVHQTIPPKVMESTVRIYFDTEKTEDWAEYPGEFIPDFIWVDKGANITWINRDIKEHTIISDNGLFLHQIQPGANFSYQFLNAGNFTYHCELYQYCYPYDMLGWVIVE